MKTIHLRESAIPEVLDQEKINELYKYAEENKLEIDYYILPNPVRSIKVDIKINAKK